MNPAANPPHFPFRDDPFDWHPYAMIFPMMSEEELYDLSEDIEKNGQLQPIQLYDGKILDGRNRYQAVEILNHRLLVEGKEPRPAHYGTFAKEVNPANDARALAYVKSHNLNRRNLTTSQRAAIGTELEEQYSEIAKREEEWDRVVNSQQAHERKSAYQAAKDVGVGQQSISRAKAIKQESPELFEQVRDGKTTVNAAYQQIRKKEPEPTPTEESFDPQIVEVTNDDVIVSFVSNLGFLSPEEIQYCLNEVYNCRKSDLVDFLSKLKITDPLLFA